MSNCVVSKLLKRKEKKKEKCKGKLWFMPSSCWCKFIPLFSSPLPYRVISASAQFQQMWERERKVVLLVFISNVNKWQYFKIRWLISDEIWQKSCSYHTSDNESLKINFEQTEFCDTITFLMSGIIKKEKRLFQFDSVVFLKWSLVIQVSSAAQFHKDWLGFAQT